MNQETKKLVFEISAQTDLQISKVGAPVYSQAATQNVTRVSIYAFQKSGADYLYTKTYEVTGWTAGTTSKTYVADEAEALAAGDYTFLAVGRDATDEYTLTNLNATTKIGDVEAMITNSGDEYEIFAGVSQNEVIASGARVSITMTRKVGGVMGYFINVPNILNGKTVKYLRLTASTGNKHVNLNTGAGSVAASSYNIFEIDLSGQTATDGIYEGNNLSTAGVVKLDNSQLGGAFMLPAEDVTLSLALYDEDNLELKTWAVKDGASDSFDIIANHFYSLGRKYAVGTTTGTDPDDEGDDDNAIDLLQDEAITITIDPAWSSVHSLILE